MSDLRQRSTNTYTGGMNKDSSDLYVKPNQYRHAENFRIISDKENQFGSLNNVVGNIESIPPLVTSNVYSFISTSYLQSMYTVTIDGIMHQYIVSGKSYISIYSQLKSFIETDYPYVTIRYNKYWMLIYCDNQANAFFTLNISRITDLSSLLVPAYAGTNGLKIIGSCSVRDDLILFSCPSNKVGSEGQIWKVTFDDTYDVPQATITLLYNNKLNFSTDKPIRDCKGNYENDECQKVYFTDDNNYLRSFNYGDINAFADPPEILDILGDVVLNKPMLDNISVGSLPCGVIQYSYKLYNKYGAETAYSPLSNMIHLAVGSDFANDDSAYHGDAGTVNSGKSVSIKISDIDKRYKFLKLVAVLYKDGTSTPEISEIADVSVEEHDEIIITDDGKTLLKALTQEEFDIYGRKLFKCKTLDTKNNLLLVANTSGEEFNVDYDARAYRYQKYDSVFHPFFHATIKEKNGVSETVDSNFLINGSAVPYTHDAINASIPTNKYQKNGVTIGGSGPNIEYSIKCLPILMGNTFGSFGCPAWYTENYATDISKNELWSTWLGDQFVDNNTSFSGYSSPFNSGQFRTYKRGETYRIGIVFYSKKGLRSPVKWIGDVKMPDITDKVLASDYPDGLFEIYGTKVYDFRTTYRTAGGEQYAIPLYLDFDVTIPDELKDEISGFEIVRVDRPGKDRSVVGQGAIGRLELKGDSEYYSEIITLAQNSNINIARWFCPEGIIDQNLDFKSGDSAKLVAVLRGMDYEFIPTTTSSSTVASKHLLYCDWVYPNQGYQTLGTVYDCKTALASLYDNTIVTNSIGIPYKYNNYYISDPTDPTSKPIGLGGTCNILSISNIGSALNTYFTNANQYDTLLVDYCRVLSNQYGGNTYENRTYNQYVTTGCYSVVSNSGIYNKLVFGGDIFINFFDVLSEIWLLSNEENDIPTSSESLCFPVESTINLALRTDKPFYKTKEPRLQESKINFNGTDVDYKQDYDLYQYNSAYSRSPDEHLFFADNARNIVQDSFDCRIRASKRKTNGKFVDVWTQFYESTYIDINSNFGAITKIINHNNSLYGLQNNAFGVASVDDRAVIQSKDTQNIVLGTGDVLPRYDYISMSNGTKHQFSVIKSDGALYFFDSNDRQIKIYSEGTGSLSDTYAIKSYIYNNVTNDLLISDNPHDGIGINGYYDDRFGEVVFSFKKEDEYITLAFNEILKCFTGIYTFWSPIYIKHYSKILSVNRALLTDDSSDTVYLHNFGNYNRFYDLVYQSKIHLLLNDKYQNIKVNDSIAIDCEITDTSGILGAEVNMLEDFFKYFRCYNEYQNTDWHTLIFNTTPAVGKQTNYDRRERLFTFQIPRNIVDSNITNNPDIFNALNLTNVNREFRERMRGKALNLELIYDNPRNRKISSQFLNLTYRMSAR